MESPEPLPSFFLAQPFISEHALSLGNLVLLGIIFLFIVGSALVSGSEIAFFSFKNDDLKAFEGSKEKNEERIYKLVNQPRYLLATILIANNFFNIGIIIASFYLLNNVFNFSQFPAWIEVVVNTVLVTFLIVMAGEVIPKVYATQKARSLAGFMAQPLTIAKKVLYPFSKLLTKTTSRMEARLQGNKDEVINADEVDMAIDLTTKGKATEEEVQMLKSIVRFGDIAVKDVMTSRPDIIALPNHLTYPDLIEAVRSSGFSRIPVFDEDLDKVIGILYAKDLLEHLNESDNFYWPKILRESYFVPENKKIDDLLEDFQSNRTHIALVVDEYGGTSGLITLEDILEEIIGDIKDEFDDFTGEIEFKQISQNKFLFEGKVSLFDMCKIIGAEYNQFEDAKGDTDSLAGLILELSSSIPQRHQRVECGDYRFTVVDVDNKRIKKVDVEKIIFE